LYAQTAILWNSDAGSTNLTSTGAEFDGQFHFELGVFEGAFVPTAANLAEWAAHWRTANPACRTTYDVSNKRYAASFTPTDNGPPFTVGKAAYVWGFRGDAVNAEWILFRAASWTWPMANLTPTPPIYWYAKDATAVIGVIHPGGSPFLMQSAAVGNAAPPATMWPQWQAQYLAGELYDGPNDDPDHDGLPNLLEFVFGTLPKSAASLADTPVAVVAGHLQITIARRIDHPATLIVEVADDLTHWQSGPGMTEVVSDGPAALVVRDLVTLDADHPRRFIRLRAELPEP
jgi:hypothetical protein